MEIAILGRWIYSVINLRWRGYVTQIRLTWLCQSLLTGLSRIIWSHLIKLNTLSNLVIIISWQSILTGLSYQVSSSIIPLRDFMMRFSSSDLIIDDLICYSTPSPVSLFHYIYQLLCNVCVFNRFRFTICTCLHRILGEVRLCLHSLSFLRQNAVGLRRRRSRRH